MLKPLFVGVAAAAALVAAAPGADARTAPSPTPTTRILAIGTISPGADRRRVQSLLPSEMRATAALYLQGEIDQWYSLEDRNGVAFILNVTDPAAARTMLDSLPLGHAHLLTFELIPLGPLKPMRQLLTARSGQ
jgi:hypothetical protein